MKVKSLSRVQLFAIPWTAAHQAPLSMGFSSQEYWSGLPFPTPGNVPDTGTEPISLVSPALAGRFFTTEPPRQSLPLRFLTSVCVMTAAAAAKSLQSCLTLCDPIDISPPGFAVPRILQARTLEWVAISFSSA